ncbi:MAG: phytoene desaturase [Saprospiraceae bacterium]|nr:phytoene desaturase [Saprospiraceae bacterium]
MKNQRKKISIIGSGISGLTAAIDLANKGYDVQVFEKLNTYGGRGRIINEKGFQFDMGPSWYWMPDLFEAFFNKHCKSTSDYFNLIRLDPSYRIFFKDQKLDSPADINEVYKLFEELETGSSIWLKSYLKKAGEKYEIGMKEFIRKPSLSILEYLDIRLIKSAFQLQLTRSIESIIHKNIRSEKLRMWLKFPILFLGAKPKDTPALYSLMNYADLILGTWYPEGGITKLFDALYSLALEKGARFFFNSEVSKINISQDKVNSISLKESLEEIESDFFISTADYHFTDSQLLDKPYRQYSEDYWNNRVIAPSALIIYLGILGNVEGLLHHNLFFDTDFYRHTDEIYDSKQWPSSPMFYICAASKSDKKVAPEHHENVFVLIPIAPDVEDREDSRNRIFNNVIQRMENILNLKIRERIVFTKFYSINEFKSDYHSFKGNAYGLSNIIKQTAWMKPRMRHKKIRNLYFAGQLTHPGPGLPPSMISGEIVAQMIIKESCRYDE